MASDSPSRKRPKLYALNYLKWLRTSGVATEAGPEVIALLVAIVTMEDDTFYRGPVTFFNEQLVESAGLGSVPRLRRTRDRAVRLGLLRYKAGAKRRPGRYLTAGFLSDSGTKRSTKDDLAAGFLSDTRTKRSSKRQESDKYCAPSNPNPNPNPPKALTKSARKFVPPTLEEVETFWIEKHLNGSAQKFFYHYEANGWTQGKSKPLKKWQAAAHKWSIDNAQFERNGNGNDRRTFGQMKLDNSRKAAEEFLSDGSIA